MNHEIYLFGSVVRGDVLPTSDVDVLAIPLNSDSSGFPSAWSIYSPDLLRQYFLDGRLFAWHLHLEAKLIYSPNGRGYITELGKPAEYRTGLEDISDLSQILMDALTRIVSGSNSEIFEYGILYTALRDIAMSASYVLLDKPTFSRLAPYEIPVEFPLPRHIYEKAMLARHCSTRGSDLDLRFDSETAKLELGMFDGWLKEIEAKL